MRQFLSFFRQFPKPLANSNTCIFVNIAWKINCDILRSKLILCEWNAFYFIEIAFIVFTLDEIKECIVFFGTPGIKNRKKIEKEVEKGTRLVWDPKPQPRARKTARRPHGQRANRKLSVYLKCYVIV